jgi:ABC-2 type transport system permease protein
MTLTRALRLAALFARVSIQNVAAYRFDMFMRIAVSLMHMASELLVVWTIFHNTPQVRGWQWQHMLVLIGVYRMVAGGLRISILPNMHKLLEDIQQGTLDFVLLRPVNAQLLVSIREIIVYRVVDVILGLIVCIIGCVKLHGTVSPINLAMFVGVIAAGYVIVYGIWLMLATLCFWFVRIQNIEMVFWNVFEAGRYPITIYPDWLRWMLTYVLPLAFITMIPAATFVGDESKMPTAALGWAILLAAGTFFVSQRFWRFGLRHYSGASA